MDKKMPSYIEEALKKIYTDVYIKLENRSIEVFLCGKKSNEFEPSIRDQVRQKIENKHSVRILYPEDLFSDILYKDKNSDLLSLEDTLAENCDIICIICESPGAFVELGAFTNNDNTFKKIIAVVEEKYKKDRSFIMLGPIKFIEKDNKNRVIYYHKDDINELCNKLTKTITKKDYLGRGNKNVQSSVKPNTIVGLGNLVVVLLFFFSEFEYTVLFSYIQHIFSKHLSPLQLNSGILNGSIKFLFKEKMIKKKKRETNFVYALTDYGYNAVNGYFCRMRGTRKAELRDGIRLAIMNGDNHIRHHIP